MLTAACLQPCRGTDGRTALFWVEPYANLTSVDDYAEAWQQFSANKRPGYLIAGSAYAAKRNGTLGFATTSQGEGEHGELMEKYGFPALKRMGPWLFSDTRTVARFCGSVLWLPLQLRIPCTARQSLAGAEAG